MLETLNLSRNRIFTLPETFAGLDGLRQLDLSYNLLTSLQAVVRSALPAP